MSPRKLPRRLPAFLAVWRGQPETEPALVDLKGLAAPVVIVHLPAALRPAAGVGSQPVAAVLLIFISWTLASKRAFAMYLCSYFEILSISERNDMSLFHLWS